VRNPTKRGADVKVVLIFIRVGGLQEISEERKQKKILNFKKQVTADGR
jgi:hypothetical protein